MGKIKAILDALRTKWSSDPAARGAAKMTMGGALVAEGLFGVVRGGGGTGTSMMGSILILIGGIIFTTVGVFMSPSEYADAVHVQGKVSEVFSKKDSDGGQMYGSVYSYNVDGKTYTFRSSSTSSSRATIGSPVEIIYSASEPRNAYRADGMDGWMHYIMLGCGVFLLAWGSWALFMSIALVVIGIWLFRNGRKDRASVGSNTGFISDLMSFVMNSKKGEAEIKATSET